MLSPLLPPSQVPSFLHAQLGTEQMIPNATAPQASHLCNFRFRKTWGHLSFLSCSSSSSSDIVQVSVVWAITAEQDKQVMQNGFRHTKSPFAWFSIGPVSCITTSTWAKQQFSCSLTPPFSWVNGYTRCKAVGIRPQGSVQCCNFQDTQGADSRKFHIHIIGTVNNLS